MIIYIVDNIKLFSNIQLPHLVPSRTRKLSPATPMIIRLRTAGKPVAPICVTNRWRAERTLQGESGTAAGVILIAAGPPLDGGGLFISGG